MSMARRRMRWRKKYHEDQKKLDEAKKSNEDTVTQRKIISREEQEEVEEKEREEENKSHFSHVRHTLQAIQYV